MQLEKVRWKNRAPEAPMNVHLSKPATIGLKSTMSDKGVTLSYMWHMLKHDVSKTKKSSSPGVQYTLGWWVYWKVLDLYKTMSSDFYGSIAVSELQFLFVRVYFPLECTIIYSFLCSRLSFIQDHSTNGIQWRQRRHALMEAPLFSYWHTGNRPNWASFTEEVFTYSVDVFF